VKVKAAHAYFCDDNDLPRIDATPQQQRKTLLLLAQAALEEAERIKLGKRPR